MMGLARWSQFLLAVTLVGYAGALGSVARVVTAREGAVLSPVTRVVELLKELTAKVESEGKAEETLFEKFICWGQHVVAAKQESNSKGQARVDELTTYIADIDAGRIEFTSERTDLEKELEELNSDMEAASELRAKESKDFEEARDEMDKAITAIDGALTVLRETTADHKTGTLLAMRGGNGFRARGGGGAALLRGGAWGQVPHEGRRPVLATAAHGRCRSAHLGLEEVEPEGQSPRFLILFLTWSLRHRNQVIDIKFWSGAGGGDLKSYHKSSSTAF